MIEDLVAIDVTHSAFFIVQSLSSSLPGVCVCV